MSVIPGSGRNAVIERLYSTYQDALYRKALSLTGRNGETARDAVQQVFLRALSNPSRFIGIDDLKTRHLLVLILRSVCSTMRGLSDNMTGSTDDGWNEHADSRAGTEEIVILRDGYGRLVELMRELPETQRAVVELKLIQDFSYEEIGSALGLSPDVARVYFSRARRRLADTLISEGY